MMWLVVRFSILNICCASLAYGHLVHLDEITSLPGLNFSLNFKQYSGYLHASGGKYLHYWFTESQRSPSKDPLILWLSGGPGCSSMEGLLSESGPLHVSQDGTTLLSNPFSWNKIANIIFLESPAGVGFSYSDDQPLTTGHKYATNDDITALNNYEAMQHFFFKFPQFRKNDFYISGESYGGMYVPRLASMIFEKPEGFNLKGFTIGNGLVDVQYNMISSVLYGRYHGLIGPGLWKNATKHCCKGYVRPVVCDLLVNMQPLCSETMHEVNYALNANGLNSYNLYKDCVASQQVISRYYVDKANVFFYLPKSNKTNKNFDRMPCIDTSFIRNWMNQASVRHALHIPEHVQQWEVCSAEVLDHFKRQYVTTKYFILELINSGRIRGLIYNGDVDLTCNFLGAEIFVDSLGIKPEGRFNSWTYNRQIAGFTKTYGNLTFATVKGAGHMVPLDKPGPAFKMMETFLNSNPLT